MINVRNTFSQYNQLTFNIALSYALVSHINADKPALIAKTRARAKPKINLINKISEYLNWI